MQIIEVFFKERPNAELAQEWGKCPGYIAAIIASTRSLKKNFTTVLKSSDQHSRHSQEEDDRETELEMTKITLMPRLEPIRAWGGGRGGGGANETQKENKNHNIGIIKYLQNIKQSTYALKNWSLPNHSRKQHHEQATYKPTWT